MLCCPGYVWGAGSGGEVPMVASRADGLRVGGVVVLHPGGMVVRWLGCLGAAGRAGLEYCVALVCRRSGF